MTKTQFAKVMRIAKSDKDLSMHDDSVMCNCALPGFRPVMTTYEAAARFVRWHCQSLYGDWIDEEVTNLFYVFKRAVTVV